VAKEIGQDPVEIPWNDTFFEIDTNMPLYINMSDLLEFATGD